MRENHWRTALGLVHAWQFQDLLNSQFPAFWQLIIETQLWFWHWYSDSLDRSLLNAVGFVRAQVGEFTSKCRFMCSKCKIIPGFMQNVQGRECFHWPICWTDHTVTDLFCRGGRERSWKPKTAAHVILLSALLLFIFSCSTKEFVMGERDRASDTGEPGQHSFLQWWWKGWCQGHHFGGKIASNTMKNLFSFYKKVHGNDCI